MSKSKLKTKTFRYPISPDIWECDGPFYEIGDDVVTWRGMEMDADPRTFVALTDCWGVDQDAVYIQDEWKRRIDRTSFRLLNPVFGVDKNAVYDWVGPVKNADPKTFRVLDPGVTFEQCSIITGSQNLSYGKDKNQVFFHEQMVGRASAIKSADAKSFQSFRNGYGADANSVYFGKAKLPKSDPESWVALRHGYSMDHARVWFQNREMKNVQRESFFVINMPTNVGFATDGQRCFHNASVIGEAELNQAIAKTSKSCQVNGKNIPKSIAKVF